MDPAKRRLYKQMGFLNSNLSTDYTQNTNLTLEQNDFKVQKKSLGLKNTDIIEQSNVSTNMMFTTDPKRKPVSY